MTIYAAGYTAGTWIDLVADLRSTLNVAAEQRPQRQDYVETADGRELGWVRYERAVMVDATNRRRTERGGSEVSRDAIRYVERGAEGHIDYVAKFALGCAEIVVGLRDAQTGAPVRA